MAKPVQATGAARARPSGRSALRDLRERLAEREAISAAIIETALDCVVVVDRDGAIVEFNPAAERTFGYARDAVVGRSIADTIIPPDQRAAHGAGFARYLAGGAPRMMDRRVEVTALHADGHRFPVELTISEVRLGERRFFTAHLRDITEQRATLAALRESESRYALAVQGSNEGIYEWDVAAGRVYNAPRLYELFGATPDEDWDRPGAWFAFVHPDDLVRVRLSIADFLRQGSGRLHIEYRIIRGDGEERWMRTNSAAMRDAEGRAVRIAGSTGDITDRKRAEEALRQSEQRFRGIAEAQPVPIVIVRRADGLILYGNPAAHALAGTEGQLAGQDLATLCAEPEHACQLLLTATETDLARRGAPEGLLRRADGGTVPVAVTVRSMIYDGADCVALGIIDLRERKQAEEQIARQREALHQSEKLTALGSLLAGVAHELNNPLSVVMAQATLLQETADNASTAARAEKIRTAADRCSRIVRTFLAMARQRPAQHGETDIEMLITQALEIADYGLRSAGIEVVRDPGPDLPMLAADGDQLTQVLLNLIVNAQQAMVERPAPRRLTIATRYLRAERAIRLEVSDSGGGIPPEIRQRIFEPFFTTKPVGAGTGVGLAVCHSIVTAHGGSIAVGDIEGGARFAITLPLGDTAVSEPEGTTDAIDLAGLRILVVDDEPDLLDSLREMLQRDGHLVDVAASGREALARIEGEDYDLILSDLRMPDIDGRDLYRALRQHHAALAGRMIFITGDTFGGAAALAVDGNAIPVVEKPLTLAALRQAIAKRLDLA